MPAPGVLRLLGPGARARHRPLRAGKPGRCCLKSPRVGTGPAQNNCRRILKTATSPEQGVRGNAPLFQLGTLMAVGAARLSLGPQEHPPERSPLSSFSRNPGSKAGCKIPTSERESCSLLGDCLLLKKIKRPEKANTGAHAKRWGKTDMRRGEECWIDRKKPLVVTGKPESQ